MLPFTMNTTITKNFRLTGSHPYFVLGFDVRIGLIYQFSASFSKQKIIYVENDYHECFTVRHDVQRAICMYIEELNR